MHRARARHRTSTVHDERPARRKARTARTTQGANGPRDARRERTARRKARTDRATLSANGRAAFRRPTRRSCRMSRVDAPLQVDALADEPLQRFVILLPRALDHDRGQMRARRRLVPVERLEIVAHVLLVEALRRRARPIARSVPEARRVGREELVDQTQLAVVRQTELELRVRDNDPALAGIRGCLGVEPQRHLLDARRELGADQIAYLRDRDVLVVRARRRFRTRREDRLTQLLGELEPGREPDARYAARLTIILPA